MPVSIARDLRPRSPGTRPVLMALRVSRVRKGQPDPEVKAVLRVRKDQRVNRGRKARAATRARRGCTATLGRRERRVPAVPPDCSGQQVLRAMLVRRGRRATRARPERGVRPERRVRKDLKGTRVRKGRLASFPRTT